MKERLESDKRQQGNAFTEMFDRLKVILAPNSFFEAYIYIFDS